MRTPSLSRSTSAEFGSLHETLLMASVLTILVIRTQLWLTNYPQLGGHGLHIAHLLWGGLFMLLAIGLLLTFLGRAVRRAAAIVGGVGFGFFIDELGKFMTADNNYFYRPAAALIYLIFIGLFVLSRALQRRRLLTTGAELANAVDLLGEATRGELGEADRVRALALLDRADPQDPLVAPLRSLFERLPTRPVDTPGRVAGAMSAVHQLLRTFAAWSGFATFVSWLFGIWALLSIIGVIELVAPVILDLGGAHRSFASDRPGDLELVNIASLASSLLSAVLVAAGALRLRRGERAAAYALFDRSLLVAIFVTQVFAFFESQFGAVFGLGVDLLLLVALRSVRTNDARGALQSTARPPVAATATATTAVPDPG